MAFGASVTSISQVAAAVASGLTGVVVARVLGPAGTGAYSVVLALVAGLLVVTTLGLDSGALYYVGGLRWPPGRAVRQLTVAALLLGLGGLGAGVGIGILLRHSAFDRVSVGALALGVSALPFALSWTFASSVLLAEGGYRRAAVAALSQPVFGLVLVTALASHFGVVGALLGITLSHGATAVWVVWSALRPTAIHAGGWLSTGRAELTRAVAFGVKTSLPQVLSFINQRADLLILNAYAQRQATVGAYGVALSLTSLQLLLPYSLSRVVIPRISSLGGSGDLSERSVVILKSIRHTVLASLVSAVCMAAALPSIPFVIGHGFDRTVALGWILVPGAAAIGVTNGFAATIVGAGRPGHLLRVTALVTPLTLGLYFVLIPRFEATGAAIASTLSYGMTAFITWFIFRRLKVLTTRDVLLPGRSEISDYSALLMRMRSRLWNQRH